MQNYDRYDENPNPINTDTFDKSYRCDENARSTIPLSRLGLERVPPELMVQISCTLSVEDMCSVRAVSWSRYALGDICL